MKRWLATIKAVTLLLGILLLVSCGDGGDAIPTMDATSPPSQTPRPTNPPMTKAPTPQTPLSPSPALEAGQAVVVYVIDGDTIEALLSSGVVARVRYIGINTPETNEPCGSDATAANAALVADRTITLVKDVSEKDEYGRLLRYVYVGDLFVNAELVIQGWAEAVRYRPDTAFAVHFEQLEVEAAAGSRGCWPTGVFGLPPQAGAVCDCSDNRYDCTDFGTQVDAQACYDYCQSLGRGDIHHLDGDGDGVVCEDLP